MDDGEDSYYELLSHFINGTERINVILGKPIELDKEEKYDNPTH